MHDPTRHRPLRCHTARAVLASATTALVAATTSDRLAADTFVVVTRSLEARDVQLLAVTDENVQVRDFSNGSAAGVEWSIPIVDCLAIINPNAIIDRPPTGVLALADGQRFPGGMLTGPRRAETTENEVAWRHPTLGRIDVPLDAIESVTFRADADPPPAIDGDVVLTTNGDRVEGLILSIGDTITVEVDGEEVSLPADRAVGAALLTPPARAGEAPAATRLWFADGTVADVEGIRLGDDGFVRIGRFAIAPGFEPGGYGINLVAAILFAPDALLPLATLEPTEVEGPRSRFVTPSPTTVNAGAPLNLSALRFKGPLVVRYRLPEGVARFAAEAVLAEGAGVWGDFELIVLDEDEEIFRARLNASAPRCDINAAVAGRELSIELTEGRHGPILDHLILRRAMLLREPEGP